MAHNPCCCCTCNNSDIVLLTDSTGSMTTYIATIRSIFSGFRSQFESATCQWCVADYKDIGDGTVYDTDGVKIDQAFTFTFDDVVAAVNGLSASGGGDLPEEAFKALAYIADNWETLGGRSDSTVKRVIVWGGDAPSHNGGSYPARADVISALTSANIKVFALNQLGGGDGLDGSAADDNAGGQASDICSATGGQLFNSTTTSDQINQALCQALA